MREREVRFTHNGSTVVWMDLCGHEVSSEWVLMFLIFLCLMERIDKEHREYSEPNRHTVTLTFVQVTRTLLRSCVTVICH
jgi:hypothetical protein